MTSISSTAAVAKTHAAPKAATRNLALDRTRTFLTLVVVVHHAVIPYTYFGHTDPKSWIGFDAVVTATDSFFMAMFFFLSGLFVWPGLKHKAPAVFLRDRLLRLGLPFAVAAFTVIPIAYYAFSLRLHPEIGFSEYWWKTITTGPWPSGPIWFVWVLLAFDLSASLLYRLSPTLVDPINRLSRRGFEKPADFFLFMLCISAVVYIPALLYFGGNRWFEFGPFSVQASRVLLYAAYFFIGAGIGMANFGGRRPRCGRAAGKEQLGLDRSDAGAVWPDVGDDLHQARNIGESSGAAVLVSDDLQLLLRRLQRGHFVRDPGLFPEIQAIGLEHARSDAA